MLAMRDIKSERFTRKWFPMPQTAPIFLLSLLSATAFAAMQLFDASRVETLSVTNGEAAVAAHLAFKWQLPQTAPPPSDTPFVLRSLGISGNNLYRTLFIFR